MIVFLFWVLLTISSGTNAGKILFVAPFPAHSHFTVNFRLAKELADHNHEVTIINPYPQKAPIRNYRDIPVVENIDFVEGEKQKLFSSSSLTVLGNIRGFFDLGFGVTEATLKHPNVQKLLLSDEQFDLVIVEHFANDAFFAIATRFHAPLIVLNSLRQNAFNNYLVGNPAPASYVPNLSGTLTKSMSFWQRVQNLGVNTLMTLVRVLSFKSKQQELIRNYISPELNLDEILTHNISLMLTNSHPSINDPVPSVPAIVEIGGYHVAPPKKLPDDLQQFLDSAREGVVLFSMGSNLNSKDLKPEVQRAILRSFGKIKQQVLWKFEAELPEAPKNVKILPWLPQSDILAHKNVRVFISHGGLLGSIEAIYHGVPIIGIPVFGDQKSNIAKGVSDGYAIAVPLEDITEESFYSALVSILADPKYTENVKHRSKLMHDQPLKPIDRAIYWVEHVMRHKGAPHLRSAALDLTWYQREMLDIAVFIVLVLLGFCMILIVAVRKILGVFRQSGKVSKQRKNK